MFLAQSCKHEVKLQAISDYRSTIENYHSDDDIHLFGKHKRSKNDCSCYLIDYFDIFLCVWGGGKGFP